MKKRMNKILSIALCAGMCVSLAACSGSSGNSDSGGSDGGKTEITIWVREQMEAPVTAAVDQYNAKQDKVKVNAVVYPDTELTDQLTLAISSGEVPDIVSLDDILAPYYNSISALADVSDEFEKLEFKDSFSEGMVDLGQRDGKQYASPFAPDVSIMFYNKEHFQAAGLDILNRRCHLILTQPVLKRYGRNFLVLHSMR